MRLHKLYGISGRHKGDVQATVNINGRFIIHYGFMVRRYVMFTLNHRDQRMHRHETNMQTLLLHALSCRYYSPTTLRWPLKVRERGVNVRVVGGKASPRA
jgi:hypothetical protein